MTVTHFYFGKKPSQKELLLLGSKFGKKLDVRNNFLTNFIQAGKTLIAEGFVHVEGDSPIDVVNLAKLR